ncbi:transposase [Arcanobacterium buesumense]|uniref:Transposase n=1 Tax=Arcanobacterium buesumense TaxID=2722751 RepID=A0A6H2EMD0_9ACTO|nr:transposase [Arcanobacterium buesumense]
MSTAQVLSELGISEATLHRWQATYGSMTRSEAKELQHLREENNSRLKRLLGQAELEKQRGRNCRKGNF